MNLKHFPRVPTVAEKRAWDAETIRQGTDSLVLMERAGSALAEHIVRHYSERIRRVHVLCGPGNNGGDGFVVARLLKPFYEVVCWATEPDESRCSPDNVTNRRRYLASGGELKLWDSQQFSAWCDVKCLVVDALLGSGLNKPVRGLLESVIHTVNQCESPVLSVDIPSGLPGDDMLQKSGLAIRSRHTVCFQAPYFSFFLSECTPWVPEFSVAEIGLVEGFFQVSSSSATYYITPSALRSLVRPRPVAGHKGTFGRVVVVGGSQGMCGAPILAARAAKAVGAGLVYLAATEACRMPAQTGLPEVIFIPAERPVDFSFAAPPNVLAIGPGWGREGGLEPLVEMAEKWPGTPWVLDADALNRLAETGIPWDLLRERCILTPHPGEFDRLFRVPDEKKNAVERLKIAAEVAVGNSLVLILKGHRSSVVLPTGHRIFNTSGNAWLASGGSGDLLTGLLAGLLAQGYTREEASVIGVWLHGRSADLAARHEYKPLDLLHVLKYLPEAMQEIGFGV